MTPITEHVDRLDQRRRWLTERIKAKQIVGWDVEYDTSERDALAWAVPHLGPIAVSQDAACARREPTVRRTHGSRLRPLTPEARVEATNQLENIWVHLQVLVPDEDREAWGISEDRRVDVGVMRALFALQDARDGWERRYWAAHRDRPWWMRWLGIP